MTVAAQSAVPFSGGGNSAPGVAPAIVAYTQRERVRRKLNDLVAEAAGAG